MLLTCPKCATRYEVDGGSIPQEGTYAHCASCENIFFVKRKQKPTIKEKAKTTITAVQEPTAPQPVEATGTKKSETGSPSEKKQPSIRSSEEKQKPTLTPEQVAAIMAGLDYEDKPKDGQNDSTLSDELTAQSQIDSILGSVHNNLLEKVITEPIASLTAETPKTDDTDIQAILESVNAQRSEPPSERSETPEAKKEVSADDIAAILASVQAQHQAPAEEVPKTATASDIDDIFASVQAQQTPTPEAEKPAVPESKEEVGADDIAAILASVQAQHPAPAQEVPKTATTDDIDAIFAGNKTVPTSDNMDSQDDIDSILMTASTPAPPESILEKDASSTTQALSNDDIDSILASVKTENKSPVKAPGPETPGNDDIISQSDLDSLFAAASAPSTVTPTSESPQETEGDIISQNDLDALLGETKVPPTAASTPSETTDIISQGDLDDLMSEDKASNAGSTTSASKLLEGGDEKMDSLFAEEAIGSLKAPAPQKAAAAAPIAATSTTAASAVEYEGVDTSMFEGLDKVVAEETSAVAEERFVEVETKPGKTASIISYIKGKLPKRKEKEQSFTIEQETLAETDHSEASKKRKTGILNKIALPMAAGIALILGAGWYYFVKMKPHPMIMALKSETTKSPAVTPTQPIKEEKKEAPAVSQAPLPAPEVTKPEEPKRTETKIDVPTPSVSPPPQEGKKPEPPPTATALAPKPKGAKEIAAVAQEDAHKAALEAEKLIPPSLVEPSVMKVGVMLPVDFNSSQVKMMTAEVELQFATSSEYKTAETKKFTYELALENEIEIFFKDKFYEETRYAKDKLMAYLFERIKKRGDLEKIVGVNVAELTLK